MHAAPSSVMALPAGTETRATKNLAAVGGGFMECDPGWNLGVTFRGSISGQLCSVESSVSTMFSKVIVAVCFIVVALARPDKPPQQGYQYQPPQPTYDPPKPTYSAPSKPEPTYSAPRVPEPTYSAPSVPEPTYSAPKEEEMPPMPFQYGYEVRDEEHGVDFSHNTDSDGPSTTGEYRVALPDGRTQIVKYTVTSEGGYVAEVTYEGEARPYVPPAKSDSSEESYNYQPPQQPQPTYNAPEPAYQAPEPPQRTYGANF